MHLTLHRDHGGFRVQRVQRVPLGILELRVRWVWEEQRLAPVLLGILDSRVGQGGQVTRVILVNQEPRVRRVRQVQRGPPARVLQGLLETRVQRETQVQRAQSDYQELR